MFVRVPKGQQDCFSTEEIYCSRPRHQYQSVPNWSGILSSTSSPTTHKSSLEAQPMMLRPPLRMGSLLHKASIQKYVSWRRSPVVGETQTKSTARTRFAHACGKSTNSWECLTTDGSREPTKWDKSRREWFWLSNSAAWGGLEEDRPSRWTGQPSTINTRPRPDMLASERRSHGMCEHFAWSELCFAVWPDCARLWWRSRPIVAFRVFLMTCTASLDTQWARIMDLWSPSGTLLIPLWKTKGTKKNDKALQELVVFWAAQMADVLHFLHQCNIIHSDYGPENFVMGYDLYIRVIDFGNSFVDVKICSARSSNLHGRLMGSTQAGKINTGIFWKSWTLASMVKSTRPAPLGSWKRRLNMNQVTKSWSSWKNFTNALSWEKPSFHSNGFWQQVSFPLQ